MNWTLADFVGGGASDLVILVLGVGLGLLVLLALGCIALSFLLGAVTRKMKERAERDE